MKRKYQMLKSRVERYKETLESTKKYRAAWHTEMKPLIIETLNEILTETNLRGEVKVHDTVENLESVTLDLGKASSGIYENLQGSDIKRVMVKYNGSLIYQQLFNGKIMVMILSPYIEGYGEPKPPVPIEILRPDELKPPFFIRHFDLFLKDITDWEDFDDDGSNTQQKAAFNPIGFFRDSEF
jgi:hypothetical protein